LPLLALLLWLVPEGKGRRAPEPAPTVNTSQLVSK
ncbi:MAG: hypothetical protein QOE24_709, partial [Frankiales bacterium]|nr:hypothetical protein [Frankiales bacterium]